MKQKEKAGLFCSILGTALTSSGTVNVGGFMLIFDE